MAARILGTFNLPQMMKEEGFPLPEHCREARLILSVDSAIMVQYDVLLTEETLAQLGRALVRLATEGSAKG